MVNFVFLHKYLRFYLSIIIILTFRLNLQRHVVVSRYLGYDENLVTSGLRDIAILVFWHSVPAAILHFQWIGFQIYSDGMQLW